MARNTTLDLRKPRTPRVALDRKQSPKEFVLASGGEEDKNKFTVHVQFEDGSQAPVYIPYHVAKGTKSSGWPERRHPPGSINRCGRQLYIYRLKTLKVVYFLSFSLNP